MENRYGATDAAMMSFGYERFSCGAEMIQHQHSMSG